MHRTALGALSLIMAGCTAQLPPVKLASLKDAPVKPDVPAAVVSNYDGIRLITVAGADEGTSAKLIAALRDSLNARSHTVNETGNWTITGQANTERVVWTIKDAAGKVRGTLTQTGLSPAATLAVSPGVMTYLPVPRVSL